jgi:hypothetical protein
LKLVRAGDLRRGPRADQRERHDAVRHRNRGAARNEGPVRMADENGAIDVERVEQRHKVGGETGNRIARVRMIRLAEPAQIERNEAQRRWE